MRPWMLALLLCSLAASARAEAPAPLGAVGLESAATRYGTSYETVYQLNLKPRLALRLGGVELTAILPLSSSATYPTYCCRTALGNATVSAAYRSATRGLGHGYEVSISAPTSRWSDVHASSLASTAALLRGAGYYLPNTTTLRARWDVEFGVTPRLWLGASAGAEYWLRHGPEQNSVVVPLTASADLRWTPSWSARASYRTLARLLAPRSSEERVLHELSGAIAHRWSGSRLEVSVALPLDDSLRELGMISLGADYVRSF